MAAATGSGAAVTLGARAGSRSACASKRTVMSNARARVVVAPAPPDGIPSYYACARGKRVGSFLTYKPPDVSYAEIKMAGSFVAVSHGVLDNKELTGDAEVKELNAVSRRVLFGVQVPGTEPAVDELANSSDGQAAWIAEDLQGPRTRNSTGITTTAPTVYTYGARGLQAVATSNDIDPTYLRVRRGIVYWRQAGQTRSHPI